MMMRSAFVLVGALSSIACGSESGGGVPPAAPDPYTTQPNTTSVVGPTSAPGSGTVVTTPSGDQCVTLASGTCVKPQDKCGTQRADVIVDSSGKVVEIVCYPAQQAPTPIDGAGNIDIGEDNKATVVIDAVDDGVDVAGDVVSKGNNVTVFGGGPGVSVVGGDIAASGNNFAARGVTVRGNVTIEGNNGTLVLSVVEGDVIVKGNNAVVAGCTVRGAIRIEGNNAAIVGNIVSKGIEPGDKNASCDGNVDAAGAAITCSSR